MMLSTNRKGCVEKSRRWKVLYGWVHFSQAESDAYGMGTFLCSS
jgi:hypothetical protein